MFFQSKVSPKIFLKKWRLQFWQSCGKLLTRIPKKLYEPIIFCKQTISLQRWLWKRRINFHNPAKNFYQKTEKVISLFVFLSKKVLQQCSSVILECSFDNRLEKFSTEARRKLWKWRFFSKKVPTQCFSGEVKCSFDNFAEIFPSEDRTKLCFLCFSKQKISPPMFLW